jgi:hypothetical protein
MYPSPIFTNLRSSAVDVFDAMRTSGRFAALWANLTGKNTKLAKFSASAQASFSNRKYLGVLDIPVEQVVGSLGRSGDFDGQFRPLKKHLRDRWVNIYLSVDNWPPALLYKIGEEYYVEDGHHRLSVARALGMAFIRAEVWEYPVRPCYEPCKLQMQRMRKPASASAARS